MKFSAFCVILLSFGISMANTVENDCFKDKTAGEECYLNTTRDECLKKLNMKLNTSKREIRLCGWSKAEKNGKPFNGKGVKGRPCRAVAWLMKKVGELTYADFGSCTSVAEDMLKEEKPKPSSLPVGPPSLEECLKTKTEGGNCYYNLTKEDCLGKLNKDLKTKKPEYKICGWSKTTGANGRPFNGLGRDGWSCNSIEWLAKWVGSIDHADFGDCYGAADDIFKELELPTLAPGTECPKCDTYTSRRDCLKTSVKQNSCSKCDWNRATRKCAGYTCDTFTKYGQIVCDRKAKQMGGLTCYYNIKTEKCIDGIPSIEEVSCGDYQSHVNSRTPTSTDGSVAIHESRKRCLIIGKKYVGCTWLFGLNKCIGPNEQLDCNKLKASTRTCNKKGRCFNAGTSCKNLDDVTCEDIMPKKRFCKSSIRTKRILDGCSIEGSNCKAIAVNCSNFHGQPGKCNNASKCHWHRTTQQCNDSAEVLTCSSNDGKMVKCMDSGCFWIQVTRKCSDVKLSVICNDYTSPKKCRNAGDGRTCTYIPKTKTCTEK